jgi:hypothetical protein
MGCLGGADLGGLPHQRSPNLAVDLEGNKPRPLRFRVTGAGPAPQHSSHREHDLLASIGQGACTDALSRDVELLADASKWMPHAGLVTHQDEHTEVDQTPRLALLVMRCLGGTGAPKQAAELISVNPWLTCLSEIGERFVFIASVSAAHPRTDA